MIFDLNTIDWTTVSSIITAIMVILTFFAVLAAFRSNKSAKRAINESKKANEISQKALSEMIYQREQTERAFVSVALDCDFENETIFFLFTNFGLRSADNVSIQFDSDFLEAIGNKEVHSAVPNKQRNNSLKMLSESKFTIAPKQIYKCIFSRIGHKVMSREENITIDLTYEWHKGDGNIAKESRQVIINLSNYHWISEVRKNKGNQPIDKISKSLCSIEKSIRNFVSSHMETGG